MEPKIVTPEEFSRYVDKHLGSLLCEVCRTQGWDLLHDPSQIDAGPIWMEPQKNGESGRRLIVEKACIVGCKHCGNIKMFSRYHIGLWLLENPVE